MKQQIAYEEFNSFYYYSGSSHNWKMSKYHFHKEYEVILFISDGASISIGNRVYDVKSGDLFLINNQEYHKTEGVRGKEYRRFVLMFDPEPVKRLEVAMGYPFTKYFENHSEEFIHKLHLSGEHLGETVFLFEQIEKSCHKKGSLDGQTEVRLRILELLLHISRMYDFFVRTASFKDSGFMENEDSVVNAREQIEKIKKYVDDHVDEKLDLGQIADCFYISRHYLSHYFRKETGFTLGQYITSRKMDRAKAMLRKGFSVTETAVALSYNSDSHFINTFKRMIGTTPKKYAVEKHS